MSTSNYSSQINKPCFRMACFFNLYMEAGILFAGILLCSGSLYAQFSGHPNALNITGPQNTLKSEIPLAEPVVKGSTYLDEEWQSAEILLKNGLLIKNFPIRIEIEQSNVEIKYNGEVKYLDLEKVDFINYRNSHTTTELVIKKADEFRYHDVPLKGIVVVHKGERYVAIRQFYIEFLQANYNVAMDIGSKDHRKVKKERLYVSKDGNLILVKGSKKKFVSELGSDRENALSIIKEKKLDITQKEDLYVLVDLL
jgi:hypothetical protein